MLGGGSVCNLLEKTKGQIEFEICKQLCFERGFVQFYIGAISVTILESIVYTL